MIFVTGGAGFIGSNFILDWLSHSDEPVVNVDCLTYSGLTENLGAVWNDPRHIFIKADIADQERMEAILAAHTPRAILNFAAESHVDRSITGAAPFLHSNVFGTYALLEAARRYHLSLDREERARFRFLQISTDEVYGSLPPEAPGFQEETAYSPNNPYAASKAAADHFAMAWHKTHGLPVLISHSCNNFGPCQHSEKLIPRMIACAFGGQPLPVYGDGQQRREWLYVKDHCAALRRILQDGHPGSHYVIGGTKEIANITLVEMLCDLLDKMAPRRLSYRTQITHVTDRPGHDRRYATNDARIRRELGWSPQTGFAEGLEATVAWYAARPHRLQSTE